MVSRLIYRAQCKPGKLDDFKGYVGGIRRHIEKLVSDRIILTFSISLCEQQIFLYYECVEVTMEPKELLMDSGLYLEKWPGEDKVRYWAPMMDIYHYTEPVSLEHWRRKTPVEEYRIRIAKLKPQLVSSYIFYHFQLQEEKPGQGNKYGIIGIHENLLFFYMEIPDVNEVPPYKGGLETSNSPSNWGEIMGPHFMEWQQVEEGQKLWRNAEVIIGVPEQQPLSPEKVGVQC